MIAARRMKLTRDSLVIRGHVYRAGDVVEVPDQVGKDYLRHKAAVVAGDDEPVTEPGRPRARSEVIAENAAATAPARAERAVRGPR
jgi:hypothetical protein